MATARTNKLPANLKERIAALEQRTTVSPTSSPNSPATSPVPDANGAQPVGKLKDRIAKFERKGGVPVPRGSFGLGAPPTGEGFKRQGELYGNRMQGKLTPQYTGGSLASIGSFGTPPQRSFSTSILNGNFDDTHTPIASPPSIASPGSPDFSGYSPEASPSPSTNGDIPALRRNVTGGSFRAALEFARKVEAAKREASLPPIRKKSTDSASTDKTIEISTVDRNPAVLVSPNDLVAHESPRGVPGDLSLQPSDKGDSFVESIAPEAAELQTPVFTPEESLVNGPRKRNLSSPKSTTIVSHNQLTTKVEAHPTPSNIGTVASAVATQTAAHSSPAAGGSEATQMSFSLPPSGEPKRGGISESNLGGSKSTPIQTPQNPSDSPQPAPILAGSFEVKFNSAESKLTDEPKKLSLEALVTAPNDADTTVSTVVPVEGSTPAVNEPPVRTRSQIPARRARPTIQPPDPPSLLSPPSSGFRSAPLSSGVSLSSASSLPSITEMNASEVSRALKMTPATGRGVPVFLPASNSHTTRKSDFVYLPSSPEANPNSESSQDVSAGYGKADSESDLTTFKTVVHGKVKATPASATLPTKRQVMTPRTPMKSSKRASILQNTFSPGNGELATLLQEAMWLEDTLNKGELPAESPADETPKDPSADDESTKAASDATIKSLDATRAKEEEERQRNAQSARAKRDLPTHGRLKHTFLMPLSKARASHKQEASIPAEQAAPKSSRETSRPKSSIFDLGNRDITHEKSPSTAAQPSPSRIPKLPSFKRFGSLSRTVSQHDSWLRHSSTSSEISSEDSNFIITPPDNALMEFGDRKPTKDADQQSAHSTLSFSFPSLSPKSIGRAASFAEKMWSRARTSSNGSALSSTSGVTHRSNEELTPQLPVLSELPSLSSPPTEKDPGLHRPASGSSLRNRIDILGPSKTPVAENILLVPETNIGSQPMSAVSMSSFGSLPSPLFDKAICDAFPSVPTDTPAQLPNIYFPRRGQGLTQATGVSADFDSALLSSAIHLAARNKTPAPSDHAVPLTSTQAR